jgi:hypothetical protein
MLISGLILLVQVDIVSTSFPFIKRFLNGSRVLLVAFKVVSSKK